MADMTTASRGAYLLVAGLKKAGVDVVFSLSGNQIMPVYDALLGSGIRIVHTRHEGAAVYMAEAYAQFTGRCGVALLTAGPGFANGLSAAWTAKCSETPVLILSGDAPVNRDGHGGFQEMPQTVFAEAAVKATGRATSAARLEADVTDAIAIASTGRPGPVHLALPDDVLRHAATSNPAAAAPAIAAPRAAAGALDAAARKQIVEAARSATKPILLAGPAFRRAHFKPALAAFAAETGIPALALESPRGLRDPRLGAFADVLREADLIIALGKPLDFMVGFGEAAAMGENCRIVQIDNDAAVLDRDRKRLGNRIAMGTQADPAAALTELTSALAGANEAAWRNTVMAAANHRPAAWQDAAAKTSRIHPVTVANAVAKILSDHPGTSLTIDGGEFGQWSQACLDAPYSVINGPSGAIGGGIAYAIAGKAARPDQPSIVMMGDGTAGFYLAEFETALRNELPFVAIIGNDGKWNAEYQIQARDYGSDRTHSCELMPTRFDQVVAAMGGFGAYVTKADELPKAIEAALSSGKAACINIEIEGLAAPSVKRND